MILMKDIIKEGHKTLTTVAKEVKFPMSLEDKKLAFDLLQYVINSQNEDLAKQYGLRPGVGIAAPQVNQSKRMFAMHCQDFDGKLYSYVMINPVIKSFDSSLTYLPGGEGCLSVDRETEGLTPRYTKINIEGFHFNFKTQLPVPIKLTLEGYPAIVFQHEFDHLNGIMFTTKLYPEIKGATPLFEADEEE
ncbi:Peptide deformylase [Alteracholeplasma palmae J233]|uniref:Peptide deformylase n=1 Tax=Alteracholeplasma palmae (strain ATCC 49389 / J233) TaxID=1318466 RepID=U4KJZ9_ALTPJ|nr:peptide deformylase [Alteracholeplasma palmae]CCV63822.1 Peptide deformylase [Alteracholeplasma palmae J233]